MTADEAYGVDTAFRNRLEAWTQPYVLAVARTTPVDAYRGDRKLTAEEAVALVEPECWEQRSAGDGAKGRRYFHWAWIALQPPSAGGHAHLLARRNNATGEIAYYLAWAPHRVSVTALIEVAGMRWRVEEYFQGSKELAALDEHQVRTWASWHRWVTLAMLAFAFLALTRAAEAPPRDCWNPCRADQVPLTCNEFRHLLVCVIAPALSWEHRMRWSTWRRRHQAVAKRLHYARQLALAA